jgi:hypothetical protein
MRRGGHPPNPSICGENPAPSGGSVAESVVQKVAGAPSGDFGVRVVGLAEWRERRQSGDSTPSFKPEWPGRSSKDR